MTGLPGYVHLYRNGELKDRVARAVAALAACTLCPRRCGVDRVGEDRGFCRTGRRAIVSGAVPHLGEEPCISGSRGSGAIFFTHCNLACMFCQNYQVSHLGRGEEVTAEELAELMLEFQRQRCHNINLVTPSHVGPQILEALLIAAAGGLTLPLVWNSGGYDGLETLALFDGVVSVYMPDFKYGKDDDATRSSRASDYVERAQDALREMYRQVGDLIIDSSGLAVGGMLVRHLVLPEDRSATRLCLGFLRDELSTDVGLSLMSQYRPTFLACRDPVLSRPLRPAEYAQAVQCAEEIGFDPAYIQYLESREDWIPDFEHDDPFRKSRPSSNGTESG